MERIYWSVEYLKVFAGYIMLFYLWPCIVFRNYLKGKKPTFRFMFCSTFQVVLINTTVLVLGILQILNVWVVRALFYGGLFVPLGVAAVRAGSDIGRLSVKEWAARHGKKFWQDHKDVTVESVLLILILLFGMAYFSHSALQHFSYGCNDAYTHHDWICGLQQGEIFSGGVYPEGMHCFIYCMNALFGIRLYSCILFLAGIHIMTFLLAAYCLLREVSSSRYTPLFVLTAFLTADGMGWGVSLEAMSRLTWTLPYEFGLYLVFLCPLFLIRFFREEKRQSESLLLLALGVSGAVAIHFYVVILAAFICLAVVCIFIREMASIRKVLVLSGTVVSGAALGAMPMGIALLMGKKAQGSLRWGMSLITKTEQTASQGGDQSPVSIGNLIRGIYEEGYLPLFGERNAHIILLLSAMLSVLLCIIGIIRYRRKDKADNAVQKIRMYEGYSFYILSVIIFIFLFASSEIGLPEFVSAERIVSMVKMLALGLAGIPIDLILFLSCRRMAAGVFRRRIVWGIIILYFFFYLFDFHEYLYWSLKRYPAAVFVTDKIMREFPANSYRIISMGDEAYQLEGDGAHEELIDFVSHVAQKEYFLPEEYIFLYVEKRPILRGQTHFITGPDWLADPSALYYEDLAVSQCPDIIHAEILPEMADRQIRYRSGYFDHYSNLRTRTVLCSKAFLWYQDFAKEYADHTEVYYEDEDIVCYVIFQNENSLLNLAVKTET